MAKSTGILERLRSRRLVVYAAFLLFTIGVIQVGASLIFYDAIDRQTVLQDHARRVAELLIVSDRVHQVDPALTPRIMTTRHLVASLAPEPVIGHPNSSAATAEIAAFIVRWEPALAGKTLHLSVETGRLGQRDLIGSLRLADGTWLNFRSDDISSSWPIALRATALTLVITLLCIAGGFLALRFLTTPLRTLSEAADAIGKGRHVPLREAGAADLRHLARSMNDMQARISGLVEEQAKSFEAISHDLRTPLSRLKIAADFVSDSDIARLVGSSADEMEAMLMSLQQFLRAQHLGAEPESVDLVSATGDLLASFGKPAELIAPANAIVRTWREPLMLALQPLLDNAFRHGDKVRVTVDQGDRGWQIVIEDNGPGIPEQYLGNILDPFFRLDQARARDTSGFGLGIPTANHLLKRFGGNLHFTNASEGGLVVVVTVPVASIVD
ncbi:MAG: ATP-binding protein [Sphingobium sp.]|uniref:ATP-binding protein n=1 Tax=Sphingobium sp. TaxID=1912891 RepID=UPI0029B5B4F7|nr:ATP-binding protein [Sphingobium sp.]MDX3909274.1 ATP-binding protein [Sphingobium sp.]